MFNEYARSARRSRATIDSEALAARKFWTGTETKKKTTEWVKKGNRDDNA
jgi:purine nucleoside permease